MKFLIILLSTLLLNCSNNRTDSTRFRCVIEVIPNTNNNILLCKDLITNCEYIKSYISYSSFILLNKTCKE